MTTLTNDQITAGAAVLAIPTAIMNLPPVYQAEPGDDYATGYATGHRDARHAAADLVLARADELKALAASPQVEVAQPPKTAREPMAQWNSLPDAKLMRVEVAPQAEQVGSRYVLAEHEVGGIIGWWNSQSNSRYELCRAVEVAVIARCRAQGGDTHLSTVTPERAAAPAALSAEHRAVIEEAAGVLESAAAYNRSKGRTVLVHSQQGRADRLREVLAATRTAEGADTKTCWCHSCNKYRTVDGFPYAMTTMILCPTCGNKRCPRANDHRHLCTGSNEPGQPGSAYPEQAEGADKRDAEGGAA